MSRLKKINLVVLVFTIFTMFSQQKIDYSLYNYSLSLINPAFSGQNNTEVVFNSKMQWVGIEGAPSIQMVSANTPIYKNLGVGLSLENNQTYIFRQTAIALGASYKVQLSKESHLLFGLKSIFRFNKGDLNSIPTNDENDKFFTGTENRFSPNFDCGLAWVNENYFAHLKVGNLIKNKIEGSVQSSRMFFGFGGGATIAVNDNIDFVPSTYFRVSEGIPFELDLNVSFEFNKKYRASLSYFLKNSLQISGLIPIYKWFAVGYGYTLYTTELSVEQKGTHQLMLVINLDNNKFNLRKIKK